jgi:hypothetical protein
MAGSDLMDQFVEAVEKVRANAKALKGYDPAAAKKSSGPAHLRTVLSSWQLAIDSC